MRYYSPLIQLSKTLALSASLLAIAAGADRPVDYTAVQESPSDRVVVTQEADSQGAGGVAEQLTESSAATAAVAPERTQGSAGNGLAKSTLLKSTATANGTLASDAAAQAKSAQADKKQQEAANEAMKNAYKGVFYANNFSYLDNPNYNGPYFIGDDLKGMADGKLDVGGEYRTRYHHENNMRGLGLTGRDDAFWLSRLRLFSNYRVTENIRFYGEYLYADSGGEDYAPRPIEENRGEAQNLFFDAKLYDSGAGTVSARLGRQELLFGEQRLISPLDWANTRRTFDGYRLTYASREFDGDLFYTNPVNRVSATGGTNQWDSSNNDRSFYGAYLTRKDWDVGTVDAYYLGYDDQQADFSYHTLGSRLSGSGEYLMYELEGGVQFGDNSNGSSHNATFVTGGLGRKMDLCAGGHPWKPTLWAYYDYASGGTSELVSRGDDGFDHLYPLAHKYLGFMDLFGRRNIHDVNMQFSTPMGSRVNLLVWYHYFFLDQATTPYGVGMAPFNAGNTAGSRDLGHEIDFLATVNLDARNSFLLGYSFFGAGRYYDTTAGVPTNADADFFYAQYQTRF